MISGKVRFGIAGLGNIAATHARAINSLPNASVTAACSRTPSNRNVFGEQFEIPTYPSFDEMLNQATIDAVAICTPSGTHLEYGMKAADAGKHVVVEKPIEVTVERGKKLAECCRKNGVKLAVIYQNRFLPGAISMKKAIENGDIGKPVMARASVKWFRDQDYYEKSGWRGTLDLDGGGAVINQAIHTLDLITWLLGDVKTLAAFKDTLTHPGIEAEDNAISVMQMENGCLMVFEASTSIVPSQPRRIEVNGTKGTAILEDNRFQLLSDGEQRAKQVESKPASGASSPLKGLADQPHTDQYRTIIDAILGDGEPVVSGEESLKSLAVTEAIYRSANNEKFTIPFVKS